jgi:hypothetical protein
MTGLTVSSPADGDLVAEPDRPPGNLLTVELCEEFLRRPDGAHVLRRAETGVPRPAP